MYDLFKNGKGNLYLYENKIELEATNFNKIEKPQDILTTTMLLMYISMKQLEKPDAKEIVVKEEEFEEIIDRTKWRRTWGRVGMTTKKVPKRTFSMLLNQDSNPDKPTVE